jgi:hypothetical protein
MQQENTRNGSVHDLRCLSEIWGSIVLDCPPCPQSPDPERRAVAPTGTRSAGQPLPNKSWRQPTARGTAVDMNRRKQKKPAPAKE